MENPETTSPSTQELLAVAGAAGQAGSALSRSARWGDRIHSLVTGVLTAGFLLVCVYVFPSFSPGNVVPTIAGIVAYAIGIVVLGLWQNSLRRVRGQGSLKRHGRGFVISEVLLGVGIAVSVGDSGRELWFWIPFALLTAAPLWVAAFWTPKK